MKVGVNSCLAYKCSGLGIRTGEGGKEGGDVGLGVGKKVGTDEGVPVGSADG